MHYNRGLKLKVFVVHQSLIVVIEILKNIVSEPDMYNISVSEIAPFGTPILKLSASDNDTGMHNQKGVLL